MNDEFLSSCRLRDGHKEVMQRSPPCQSTDELKDIVALLIACFNNLLFTTVLKTGEVLKPGGDQHFLPQLKLPQCHNPAPLTNCSSHLSGEKSNTFSSVPPSVNHWLKVSMVITMHLKASDHFMLERQNHRSRVTRQCPLTP